jgi:hypothetical protein
MAGLYSLPGLILRSLRRRPKASFVITQKNRVITKPAKTGESRFFPKKRYRPSPYLSIPPRDRSNTGQFP